MIADELKIVSGSTVYSPREDSHLLAAAVEKHAFGRVLDLGAGTGIQGITAFKKGCSVVFADISDKALKCARKNAEANSAKGEFIKSDLFSNITVKFNTIIFNPPYLHSKTLKDINIDGGKGGRETIDRFISQYKYHVEDSHRVLMLESSLNSYMQDIKRLDAEIVCREHLFFEDLVVLMFR